MSNNSAKRADTRSYRCQQWSVEFFTHQSRTIEIASYPDTITLHYITLHYRYFIRHLHLKWPVVLQQSYVRQLEYASVNRWVFSCLLKVHVSVSSWRAKGRSFQAFGPAYEKLLSPNLRFNNGSSYRKVFEDLSLPRLDRSAVAVTMSDR